MAAVKIGSDLNIFGLLAHDEVPQSTKSLAEKTGAQFTLIGLSL